jgi:hypothetical protein
MFFPPAHQEVPIMEIPAFEHSGTQAVRVGDKPPPLFSKQGLVEHMQITKPHSTL